MNQPIVSVVIPTYGRDRVLVDTIKQVLAQDFAELELLVVDQSREHDPDTASFLAQQTDPRLRYFQVQPPSLPAARNFAIAHARAKLILFIDDDVLLKPGFVQAHVDEHAKSSKTGAVAGRVIQAGRPPTGKLFYFDRYGLEHNSYDYDKPAPIGSFPGGNFSVKMAAFGQVGRFDPHYSGIAVREESDMADRLIAGGYKIRFQPEAALIHLADPRGGCRITIHQYDNASFYENDLYYSLRTVAGGRLALVLARKYLHFTLTWRCWRIPRRNWLFFRGLATAQGWRHQPPLEAVAV